MSRSQHPTTVLRSAAMQSGRRSTWTIALGVVLAVYVIGLCCGTHTPLAHLPITIHNDVLYHFGAYFVLASIVFLVLHERAIRTRAVSAKQLLDTCLVAWITVCAFGFIDESTQPFVGRHFEWKDVSADFFGAALGVMTTFFVIAIFTKLARRRRRAASRRR